MSRWGDDEDDDFLPATTFVGPDKNGIKTYTEYKLDETNRKIKVTRKVKVLKKITRISPEMKERRNWSKFGHASDDTPGVDPVTTQTSFEVIDMEDPDADLKEESTDNLLDKIALSGVTIGSKWRSGLGQGLKGLSDSMPPPEGDDDDFPALGGGKGKYVPPSMRGKGGGDRFSGGSSMSDRDDSATLRVTNISEETNEDDLRELFGNYGRIKRCYLAKDRETGRGRGFAFISFHTRQDAERAMNSLQGHGYDHLILKIEFAQPRKDDGGGGGGGGQQFRSGYGQKLAQDTTEKVATFSQHRSGFGQYS